MSRCCRSLNGATSGVADHQQLAVQRHIGRHRRGNIRKGGADVVSGAGIDPLFAAPGDELNTDPVPFPLREIIVGVEARDVGVLQRLGQHQRGKGRQIADLGRRMAALEPIEQRLVRRGEPVPDLFDAVEFDTAPFGERGFGQAGRDADPQLAGDELQQRPATRCVERVEPRLEQPPGPARGSRLSASRRSRKGSGRGLRRPARRARSRTPSRRDRRQNHRTSRVARGRRGRRRGRAPGSAWPRRRRARLSARPMPNPAPGRAQRRNIPASAATCHCATG